MSIRQTPATQTGFTLIEMLVVVAIIATLAAIIAPNVMSRAEDARMTPWKNPYYYTYPGENGEFDVYSLGADGIPGGEGEAADIGNWNMDEQ